MWLRVSRTTTSKLDIWRLKRTFVAFELFKFLQQIWDDFLVLVFDLAEVLDVFDVLNHSRRCSGPKFIDLNHCDLIIKALENIINLTIFVTFYEANQADPSQIWWRPQDYLRARAELEHMIANIWRQKVIFNL